MPRRPRAPWTPGLPNTHIGKATNSKNSNAYDAWMQGTPRSDTVLYICVNGVHEYTTEFKLTIARSIIQSNRSAHPNDATWTIHRGSPTGELIETWKDGVKL